MRLICATSLWSMNCLGKEELVVLFQGPMFRAQECLLSLLALNWIYRNSMSLRWLDILQDSPKRIFPSILSSIHLARVP